ncbi:MAG: Gfo/Idh/MocA family oxidoreductase [Verrucomicrobiales bacterium]|nr:Gfo/Idh/MocA family oxidoreductase [Verrucomicrobiales bacterium]
MKPTPQPAVSPLSRRRFLAATGQTSALFAASGIARQILPSARAAAPSDRVVLALMGAGGRGSQLARNFSAIPGVRFKYVAEVNPQRGGGLIEELERAQGRAPRRIDDIRRAFDDPEVDAVVIATPEHWHALATVWACQAGKDVYVEKTISLTVWEGRQMVRAARKYDRVVQAGFQNRSAPYGLTAREYLRSGRLGRVTLVKVYNLLPGGPWTPKPDAPVPGGLDWDAWLGPAPKVPFNPGRLYGWGDFWDYEGGVLAGDASHQLDLTRLALGDPAPPRSALCQGGRLAFPDERETPDLQVVTYDYGDFVMVLEQGTFAPYMRKFNQEERYGDQWPYWPQIATRAEIYGTRQMMRLGRHGCGWQVFEGDGKVVAEDKGHFPDQWHQPNFIDCVRSRKQPNADVEQAHQSALLVHLANVSYRVGCEKLTFDAEAERFGDNPAANRFLRPVYRDGYRLPEQV